MSDATQPRGIGTALTCVHGDRCGGCTRLGVPYSAQLDEKHQRLRTALSRYLELREIDVREPRPARSVQAYRTRAKLVVGAKRSVGLYAKGGDHEVVDVTDCKVLAPVVKAAVDAARAVLRERRETNVSAVDVREHIGADGLPGALVTFVATGPVDGEALADALVAQEPRVTTVALSEREEGSPRVLGGAHRIVRGEPARKDLLGNGRLYELAAPGAFVQSHRGTAEALRETVARAIEGALGTLPGKTVRDVFAGSGGFGLVLASRGAEVLAVESFAPAVVRANEAAQAQGLERYRAVVGDALRVLPGLGRADAVVVDPPRRGLSPALRALLTASFPRAIAYVSCEPATFARDLAHFARLGWSSRDATPFDMLPQTAEVEAFALLVPATPPRPRVLFMDETLVAIDKDPHEPTTPQGEHIRATLDRVQTLHGFDSAIPIHRLDAGTSGVCLFAKRAEHVARWQKALAEGEKEYHALVRGIPREKGSISRTLRDEGRALPARTRYKRIAIVGGHGLVVARPDEGRLHQVRRHLASIGHPVLGDVRYGHAPSNRHLEEKHGLDRAFLHCARITLAGGLTIAAPLAPDLDAVRVSLLGSAGAARPSSPIAT